MSKSTKEEAPAQIKELLERVKRQKEMLFSNNSYSIPRPPPNPNNSIKQFNNNTNQPNLTSGHPNNPVRPNGPRPIMHQMPLSHDEIRKRVLENERLMAEIEKRKKDVESKISEPKLVGGLNMKLHPFLIQSDKKFDKEAINSMIAKANFATAKVNQRQQVKPVVKEVEKPKQQESITRNPYFDPELGLEYAMPKPRLNRSLKFNQQGKWIEKGNQIRAEAMVEKLREQIAERAKAAGMEEELELVSDKVLKKDPPPEVEWWDREFFAQPAIGIERVFDYNKLEFETHNGVTNLVQHPIPIKPPFERRKVVIKPLMLTKKERKKIRRQRRAESLKEKQEKIRLGLLPPEQTKVKLSNLMRVLASEATQDPTKIEKQVREQVEQRKRMHEKMNQDRKLTPEERKEKIRKKTIEDIKQHGLISLVFKVRSLDSRQKKFKVDKNAIQLSLSGIAIMNSNFCLIVVEGGPKSIKAYKKLMLRRIQWDDEDEELEENDPKRNYCHLVWEGEIQSRLFKGFSFRPCPTESIVRQTLSKNKAEHYWELAKAYKGDYLKFEKVNL